MGVHYTLQNVLISAFNRHTYFKGLNRRKIILYPVIYHFSCSSFFPENPSFPLVSFPFRTSFNISFIAVFLVMNPLSFLSSENVFISHLFIKNHFAGYRILSLQVVSFSVLKIFYCPLPSMFCNEKCIVFWIIFSYVLHAVFA